MIVKVFVGFLAFAAFVATVELTPSRFVPANDTNVTSFRLPNDTVPEHYYVSLTTDVHDDGTPEFSGRVSITVRVIEETSVITLHYRQLTVTRMDLYNYSNPTEPELIEEDIEPILIEEFEFLRIRTTATLAANQLVLVVITYNNTLRDVNTGFYRSFYNATHGERNWLAPTVFEGIDARHAFPCYDEPGLRASFTIEIKHHMSFHAISNWPANSVVPEYDENGNRTNNSITTFQRTYGMITHLVGFTVSNFTFIERGNQRVYARSEVIANGEADFALNAGIRTLEVCEQLWGVPYTLPKVTQIAVPDLTFTATEEWAFLKYREEALLFNNRTSTLRNQEAILRSMGFVYSHLWFGNLVSFTWWHLLWLKGAFGLLHGRYLNSLAYPEDRWMDSFVVESLQNALTLDGNPNVRPMTHHIQSNAEVDGLFDGIPYDKAGSVMWMMQNAIGNSTYIKGLRYYLQANANRSADSEDLYAAIQASIDEDFSEGNRLNFSTIMRTWELQSGCPLITLTRNGSQLRFEQERFFSTNNVSDSLWWIPINYVVGSNPNFTSTLPQFWLDGIPSTNIECVDCVDNWIVVNSQQSGYYRVNYDNASWRLLSEQLNNGNFEQIHVLNRAQLVDDSLNLAQAGRIDFGVAFDILRYLSRETDNVPWAAATRSLTLLNRRLASTDAYPNYQRFIRQIVEPLLIHLGFEVIAGEHRMDRFARTTAINLACEAGLPLCLNQTAARLEQVLNGTELAPDLHSAIFCEGLRQGNATHFNFLHNRMRNSTDQAHRTLLQIALGCSQDTASLTQFMQTAFTNEHRLVDKIRILSIPQNNGELGLRVMMNLIRTNHDDIINVSPRQVNTMLSNIASRVASVELFNEFDSLLSELQELNRITEAAVISFRASANGNLNWQQRFLNEIRDWLEANVE